MWNKFTIIWNGLSGHFRGYHTVESRYWLYVIGSVVSLLILWVNASVSFNFYRLQVFGKAIGLHDQSSTIGAAMLTFILAFAAWVLLAFLAYLLSARLNNRRTALIGISKSDVFFSLLGVVFLAGIDIYANLHGVEAIVESSTTAPLADPTVKLDTTFEAQRMAAMERIDHRRSIVQQEIDHINRWTGKAHSCTRTGCPTQQKGQGTIGAHWKGTLTGFGSQRLSQLKTELATLADQEKAETERIAERKSTVQTSLLRSYKKDEQRYHTELQEKNRTLKGFVLLAYPFSFIIEFLLAGITFLALEYLYETDRLQRPIITVYQNGEFDSSTEVLNGERYNGTSNGKPKKKAPKKGYEVTCAHCGTVTTKHHPRARFCSDECRIKWNEAKKGYSVASIKRRKTKNAVS